jgi:hypothetical protein
MTAEELAELETVEELADLSASLSTLHKNAPFWRVTVAVTEGWYTRKWYGEANVQAPNQHSAMILGYAEAVSNEKRPLTLNRHDEVTIHVEPHAPTDKPS